MDYVIMKFAFPRPCNKHEVEVAWRLSMDEFKNGKIILGKAVESFKAAVAKMNEGTPCCTILDDYVKKMIGGSENAGSNSGGAGPEGLTLPG